MYFTRKILLIATVTMLILLSIAYYKRGMIYGLILHGPDVGDKAPEVVLQEGNKSIVRLSSFKGKTIMLHFMASWCADCIKELPAVQVLYNKKRNDPDYVFLNVAFREDQEATKAYFREKGYDLPIYGDPGGNAAREYGIRGVPSSVIINANGIVQDKINGAGKLKYFN
jgi:thiol-disulfide isomerase/thioredoxin